MVNVDMSTRSMRSIEIPPFEAMLLSNTPLCDAEQAEGWSLTEKVLSKTEKKMENRKQETPNWKLVNWPVLHFRFSVSCFPLLSWLGPALPLG